MFYCKYIIIPSSIIIRPIPLGADKPAPRPLYGFTRSFRPLLQANLISAVLVPIGHGIHAALDKS